MNKVGIIFPHQLFENSILISTCDTVYLVEEWLFFKQYNFHQQKIAFHRATMQYYQSYLIKKGINVVYVHSPEPISEIQTLIAHLKSTGVESIEHIDTIDNWLEKRISNACKEHAILSKKHNSPLFINTPEEINSYFSTKKKMFQTDFYKYQRIKQNILIDNQEPLGGKWTFDDENRLKYPKEKNPPSVYTFPMNENYAESIQYTKRFFSTNYGKINEAFIYPTNFEESKIWLNDFFKYRFMEFGAYEDAIVSNEIILHHSILTPMLNVGLLSPQYIIDEAIMYSQKNQIPLNSLEGFIRQIIGWREFIRAVYQLKGSEERTKNFWKFTRKIPTSFWNGTTGIEPIDLTIKKVLATGYCHHIERLMVLGNFMLLCEFDPNEVYRWFMELFIDSYDWVMVPNVYGMSQFADGGLMATKPYISGSNYLMKMSDYKKGDWQQTWDGLFWRFMHVHRNFFLQNPRLGMLVKTFDKMSVEKQQIHLNNAENYLATLQ
ncbi:MAG: cryptochrome/photolyase family protein [Sphingobacteriia bacterium]|jgi:deoxyribodipyrimidine photolyase-related protein